MKKRYLLVCLSSLLLLSCSLCYADFDASNCFLACSVENNNCSTRITSVNDIEIKDQKDACSATKTDCDAKCNESIQNEAREREKSATPPPEQPSEQQELPPQEQQDPPPQL